MRPTLLWQAETETSTLKARCTIKTTDYIRPNLGATKSGMVAREARGQVENWLDQLDYLLSDPADLPPAPQWSYDLLAAVGWLQRVRPELLQELDTDRVLDKALDRIRPHSGGITIAENALAVPNLMAWLEEAQNQATDSDTNSPESARQWVERAEVLLLQLDEADLVSVVAAQRGRHDKELACELDACHKFLVDHVDAFLPAALRAQIVGQVLRSDLPEHDPELALTAEKFCRILDEAENVEAELGFVNIQPLAIEALRQLARHVRTSNQSR